VAFDLRAVTGLIFLTGTTGTGMVGTHSRKDGIEGRKIVKIAIGLGCIGEI
jgi:hypothetical protein